MGRFRFLVCVVALIGAVVLPTAALAHPHTVTAGNGKKVTIANGQNHGPFISGVSCGGDPAAYGLETAHHGPDSGTPGKSDGCYQIDGLVPGDDDRNPAID
jgi:hypothetical protein